MVIEITKRKGTLTLQVNFSHCLRVFSNSCFPLHTCIQNSCFPSAYLPFRLFSLEAGCPFKFHKGLLAFEFLAPKAYLQFTLFQRSAHSAGPTIFPYLHDLISCWILCVALCQALFASLVAISGSILGIFGATAGLHWGV